MGKLLLKLFFFTLAIAGSCVFLYSINPVKPGNSNEYMAAIIDKHHRLDSLPSPKLIFIGASNLAFGLDCKMIEDSLNIPVVNMGLHGGLGLPFILNESKSGIGRGDIVVVSIEYYLTMRDDAQLLKRTIELYPPAAGFLNPASPRRAVQSFLCLDDIASYIKKVQSTVTQGIPFQPPTPPAAQNSGYRRSLFSAYGDVVNELNNPKPPELRDSKMNIDTYQEGIGALNEFGQYVQKKGASAYLVYPNYPRSAYEKNRKAIYHLSAQYNNSLSIEVINTPEDFVLPDSLFIDTVYHLNKEGRQRRTIRMIEILRSKVFERRNH